MSLKALDVIALPVLQREPACDPQSESGIAVQSAFELRTLDRTPLAGDSAFAGDVVLGARRVGDRCHQTRDRATPKEPRDHMFAVALGAAKANGAADDQVQRLDAVSLTEEDVAGRVSNGGPVQEDTRHVGLIRTRCAVVYPPP
jgi:hypothetical protein